MVFEKTVIFRKEKSELVWLIQGGIFLFFQPGVKQFQAEFRMICTHEEKEAGGHLGVP